MPGVAYCRRASVALLRTYRHHNPATCVVAPPQSLYHLLLAKRPQSNPATGVSGVRGFEQPYANDAAVLEARFIRALCKNGPKCYTKCYTKPLIWNEPD